MGKIFIDLSPPLVKFHILHKEDHRNSIVDGYLWSFYTFCLF